MAEGAVIAQSRGQASLRAQVWTMYTQAEVLLKKPPPDIDPKTNMKLSTQERQEEDLTRRKAAL